MAKGVKPEVETVLAELDAMLEALPVVATDPSATTSDLSDAFDGVNRSPAGSFGALLDGHDDDAFTSEEVDALLSSAAAGGDLTTAEDGASRAVLKSPVKTEKKRAVPYRRKRKRPKDELDYLRGKVDELQAELSALRQHDRFSPSEQLDDCDVDSMSERWRHIASHQKEEVGRSMDENARLRALLEGQLNVAKRLQDALEQVQNIARIEVSGAIQTARRFRALSISDPDVFTALSDKLEEQYLYVNDMLRSGGVADVHRDMIKDIQLQSGPHGLYFEKVEVRITPFPMAAVNRAMWRTLSLGTLKVQGVHYKAQDIVDDTINATIIDTLQLPASSNIAFKMKISMRRYREAGRIVAVWSGVVEIDGSVSVRLREQGWSVLEPFAMAGRDPSTACIARNIVHVHPEMSDIDSDNSATHVGAITNLVIGTYHRNIGMMNQLVENLLVSDMANS